MIPVICTFVALVGVLTISLICFSAGRRAGLQHGYLIGRDTRWADDLILRGRLDRARRHRNGQFRARAEVNGNGGAS